MELGPLPTTNPEASSSNQPGYLQGSGSLEKKKGPTVLALPTMLPSSLELIASPASHPNHPLASSISSKAWAPLPT